MEFMPLAGTTRDRLVRIRLFHHGLVIMGRNLRADADHHIGRSVRRIGVRYALMAILPILFLSSPHSSAQTPGTPPAAGQPLIIRAPAELPAELAPQWIKVCSTNPADGSENCITSQSLRNNDGALIASANVQTITGQPPRVIVALPVGVLLPHGFRLRVDKNPRTVEGAYRVCTQACIGGASVDADFIAEIKRGGEMYIVFWLGDGRIGNIVMPLSGVTKAIDGPAVDPEVLRQRQQDLETRLRELGRTRAQNVPDAPSAQ